MLLASRLANVRLTLTRVVILIVSLVAQLSVSEQDMDNKLQKNHRRAEGGLSWQVTKAVAQVLLKCDTFK